MLVIQSNHYKKLLQQLEKKLSNQKPFQKTHIWAPSFATQYDLKHFIAEHAGVFMGIKIDFLESGVKALLKDLYPGLTFLGGLDLPLKMHAEFQSWLSDRKMAPLDKDLYDYFESISSDSKEVAAFCQRLSKLYKNYFLYGALESKDRSSWASEHWQLDLYNRIGLQENYDTLFKFIEKNRPEQGQKLDLFLFGYPFVPYKILKLLKNLHPLVETTLFCLNPSHLFWTDTRNEYEKQAFVRRLEAQGATQEQLFEYKSSYNQDHPLLASLSKLSRHYQNALQSLEVESKESFVVHHQAVHEARYNEVLDLDLEFYKDTKMSLLERVRMDILTLSTPSQKVEIDDTCSLYINKCSHKLREVEELKEKLCQNLEDNEVCFNQSVVYASDLPSYLPYLESVFSKDPKIELTIHDKPYHEKNKFLKGLSLLIDLNQKGWLFSTLNQLLYHPYFRLNQQLSDADHSKLMDWIKAIHVQWGYDQEEQKAHLGERGKTFDFETKKVAYSWEDFLFSFLELFCAQGAEGIQEYALREIEFSDLSIFNSFVECLIQLRQDLNVLKESQATFNEWSDYLQKLIDAYFPCHDENQYEQEGLKQKIELFKKQVVKTQSLRHDFIAFWSFLYQDFSSFHTEIQSHQLGTLEVYSIESQPLMEKEHVYLLGLDEASFPRQDRPDSLSLMDSMGSTDYFPLQQDKDRDLFLKLILTTRKKLYISYVRQSDKDQKEVSVSPLVEELMEYLDRYYQINGQTCSSVLIHESAPLAFDQSYLKGQKSQAPYLLAKAFYSYPKKALSSYLLEMQREGLKCPVACEQEIFLKDLFSALKNPVRFYLKNHYGSLPSQSFWHHEEKHFSLNPSQSSYSKKQSIGEVSWNQSLRFTSRGHLKELSMRPLYEEQKKSRTFLESHQLLKEVVTFLEFRKDIDELYSYRENHLLLPSIKWEINEKTTITLSGSIDGVSQEGIISASKPSYEEIFCLLPKLIVAYEGYSSIGKPFKLQILFPRAHKVLSLNLDHIDLMKKGLIEFYWIVKSNCLPIQPQWISLFLDQEISEIVSKITTNAQSDFFSCPLTQNLLRQKEFLDPKRVKQYQYAAQLLAQVDECIQEAMAKK